MVKKSKLNTIPQELSLEEQYQLAEKIISGEEKIVVDKEKLGERTPIPKNLLIAEKCRRDLYYFLSEFWTCYNSQPLVPAPFIEFLCKELQFKGSRIIERKPKDGDFIFNCPPGVGKTSILISYAAWLIANDASITILYAMYAHDMAEQKIGKIKKIIQSDKFKSYFPNVKIQSTLDRQDRFEFTEGGRIACCSPKSQLLSSHFFVLICDDIQDANRANSRTERKNLEYWIDNTLLSRKDDKEITILVFCQQRLRQGDCTDYLLSKGKIYTHIVLPGEYNESIIKPHSARRLYKNLLLEPKRLSVSSLKEMHIDLGPGTFQSQVNQNPADKSASIIKEEWMPIIEFTDWQLLIEGKTLKYNFYIDGAYTGVTTNDSSAIVATARIPGSDILYIIGVSQVWKEFAPLCKHIYHYCESLGLNIHSKVLIEPKGPGLDLISALRQDYPMNAMQSPSPRGTKQERLSNISGLVMGGKVALLKHDEWNRKLLEEITTNDNPRDDIQDAFCMAVVDNLVTGRLSKAPDFRVIDFQKPKRNIF